MKCEQRPIVEFVRAELGPRTSATVAAHVRNCAVCRGRVQVLAALTALSRDRADGIERNQNRRRPYRLWPLAAAVLLCVFSLGVFFRLNHSGPDLRREGELVGESHPYFPLETRANLAEGRRSRAFQAYAEGDYERAARLLSELAPEPEVLFYRGVCLYLSGSAAKALELLRHPSVMQSPWRVPALWYQVNTLLQLDRRDDALELLRRDEFRHGPLSLQARELRKRLGGG